MLLVMAVSSCLSFDLCSALPSIKAVMSLYKMHVGKNIGTGMIVLLPSVNTLHF